MDPNKVMILSDFDRTLAPEENGFVIEDYVVKEVNSYSESNLFFVVTGRERKNVRGVKRKSVFELSNGLIPTGWILENGSMILYRGEHIMVSKQWLKDMDEISRRFSREGIDHAIGETIIFADNTLDKRELLEEIVKDVSQGRGKVEWNTDDAMVMASNVDKGRGIMNLVDMMQFKGIKVGIGDAQNDISLFQNVDVKVAMGNAIPEIKKIADIVMKGGPGDGVLEVLDMVREGRLLDIIKQRYI
ncbi:HAD-IIB family hydrolase [Sulfuracidifex metallicus]|uniref:HAD-IIB family hydrolase n=1 Tax=Sulfuracidifex metallicus TaxID=47303 RepID=UPI002275B3DC|nr:HAD-IIB family hydrolase [Sulfuracidifex metallicus]MCY0850248.1 HAD-IIB family hydrolase [Sulfuracidifex metallicus]